MIDRENLHHAYLFLGDGESLLSIPETIFELLGVSYAGNPDILIITLESFGIDDARKLSLHAEKKAFGERKLIFVRSARFTVEAQNALLKTLEEPKAGTHFFILAESEKEFLPTLLSRVQRIELKRNKHNTEDAEKFVGLSYKDRLAFAKAFGDEEKNLPEFLDGLLVYFREKGKSKDLEKVFEFRKYANDRAKSSRLILEHLALVLDR